MTHKLVGEGIRNIKEMQRALRLYVKMELFEGQPLPLINSRCFYLEKLDIRNYMYNANAKLQVSKVVQENLEIKIKNWEKCSSEDSFYFCAYGDEATSIDHKWRPFCNEHGGNISGVSMCFHFVCRYMKFGLRTCNFTKMTCIRAIFPGFCS